MVFSACKSTRMMWAAYAMWRHVVGGAAQQGSEKMAGVRISASHLKYLQFSRSKWNPIDLQRSAHRFRRCLTTVLPHRSSPGDDSTAHAPSRWQLLGASGERCYSTASVATISLSPAVKYLVDTNNISDLSLIKPSGPKDRILKGYSLQYTLSREVYK